MPTFANTLGNSIADSLFASMGDPLVIVRGSARIETRGTLIRSQRLSGEFQDIKTNAIEFRIRRALGGIRAGDNVEYDGNLYVIDQPSLDNGFVVGAWAMLLGPISTIPLGTRTTVDGRTRSVVDGRTRIAA
jgi:hypothetical protein